MAEDMTAPAPVGRAGKPEVEWLLGKPALDWTASAEHRRQWLALYDACPWANAFQHPSYFDVWCRHYGQQWTPLLLIARNALGTPTAIMPLAVNDTQITGVGAHQAEYHGFLSGEADAGAFLESVLDTLDKKLPGRMLRLRYLPPGLHESVIEHLRDRTDRITLNTHRAHILTIDRTAIEASLKKKGNKSKLNRLKRGGELDLRRFEAADFAHHLRRIAAMYDFRQGAMNGVCPFAEDPKKAAFHLDWMKSAPQQLHASALMLDGEIASAMLLVMSPREAHLAISAHAPEHAENSPMKFHIYQTALALADEGRTVIDLTPGGDPWKARFSTGERDVCELIMHRSLADAARTRAIGRAKSFVKSSLGLVGLNATRARAAVAAARDAVYSLRGSHVKPAAVTYRLTLPTAVTPHPALHVNVNDLEVLARHGAGLTGRPRSELLREALTRLEAGERVYTVDMQGAPFALAWSANGGETLYDVALTGSMADAALAALVNRAAGTAGAVTIMAAVRDRTTRDALTRMGAAQE